RDIVPRIEPARPHARTTHADEPRFRKARAQRLDEIGAELITGIFAGDQRKQRAGCRGRPVPVPPFVLHGHYRTSDRSLRSMKSQNARTSSLPPACSASAARASSSVLCDM